MPFYILSNDICLYFVFSNSNSFKGITFNTCSFNVVFTQELLKETGKIDKIENILITHSHMDHIGGLIDLIRYKIANGQPFKIVAGNDFEANVAKQ